MENPFLDRTFEIKWSRLGAADVAAAVDRALADAESAITAITGQPVRRRTIATPFLALRKRDRACSTRRGRRSRI
jgi:oligopeptidase A